MHMRKMFAEFEEILIADWQYDELEIPLKLLIYLFKHKKCQLALDLGGYF